jgi:hypothetical protein
LDKFRDNEGNWREQRVEEDTLKGAVSYTVREDEKERGKVRFERQT